MFHWCSSVALIKLCVEHVGGRLFQLLTTLELGCIWKLSTMLQPLCSCGGYYAQGHLNSLFDGPGCCVLCKSFSFKCWNYGNMSSEFRAFCGKQGFSSLETGSASIIFSGRDSATADSITSSRGEVRCQRCQELCSVVDGHGSCGCFSKVDQDHHANGCICITMSCLRGRRLRLQVARWMLRHQSHMCLRRRRE